MSVDTNKIHFSNFFNVVSNPEADLKNGEVAFDSDFYLNYKDENGVVHKLPGISDYNNIYSPATIKITQSTATSVIGVGDEGDFRNKVTTALPHSLIVRATGIHRNNALVQYNASNVIKDVLPLPAYLCKVGTYADEFNVNTGILTENVEKTKILSSPERTALTNNSIFKVKLLSGTDVNTTFEYPMTTEANKDVIEFRNYMYIGNDNYLYIIKDLSTTTLPVPFVVFTPRSAAINYRLETKYFLFEPGDTFKMLPYRRTQQKIVDPKYTFIESTESYFITGILRAQKTVNNSIVYDDNLTVDGTGKAVENIDKGNYYDIIVSTNEALVYNASIIYEILDISNGYFAYLYKLMKAMNSNSSGAATVQASGGGGDIQTTNYMYTYIYNAISETEDTFVIPANVFSPSNGDTVLLFYQGLKLDRDVDYTLDEGTNTIVLNFDISSTAADLIECAIFKCRIGGFSTGSVESYVYNAVTPTDTTFVIPESKFAPDRGDVAFIYYKNLKLHEGINYELDATTNTVTLGFSISSTLNEKIICVIFRFGSNNILTGDSSENTIAFQEAEELENVESNEMLKTIIGKVKKYLSFIGNTALSTTAKTISAAINEVAAKVFSVESKLTLSQVQLSQLYNSSLFQVGTGADSNGNIHNYRNIVDGQCGVKVEGMSIQNLVPNGNIANGVTNWLTTNGAISATNNMLTQTSSNTNNTPMAYIVSRSRRRGQKFYIRYKAMVTNSVCTSLTAKISGSQDIVQKLNPEMNVWYTLSNTYTDIVNDGVNVSVYLIHNYANATAANGAIMNIRDVMLIDLTAQFGAGNEPTKEQCDYIYDQYIDELQGVGNFKITSIGKNLFNGVFRQGSFDVLAYNLRIHTGYNIKINANTPYTISTNLDMSIYNMAITHISDNKDIAVNNEILSNSGWLSSATYTLTPTISGHLAINIRRIDDTEITPADMSQFYFQVEEGSIATTYESYRESIYGINLPGGMQLHKLPNGICDSIVSENNTDILYKNTGEYIVTANDITGYDTAFPAYDRVFLSYANIPMTKQTDFNGFRFMTDRSAPRNSRPDATNVAGTHYISDMVIIICVAKGEYANIAAAQTAFAGTKIIYQLPKTLKYKVGATDFTRNGNISAYTNGSVIIKPLLPVKSTIPKLTILYNLSDKAIINQNSNELSRLNKTPSVINDTILKNGCFRIWQRGTTFNRTSNTGSFYTADRWCCYKNAYAAGLIAERVMTDLSKYALKVTNPTATQMVIAQVLEASDVYPLRGKEVTFTIDIKVSVPAMVTVAIAYLNSAELVPGATPTANIANIAILINPTSEYTTVSITGMVPNDAVGLGVFIYSDIVGSLYVSNAKLELGRYSTPLVRRSYAEELALCQRYYEVAQTMFIIYATAGSQSMWNFVPFKVTKRTTPTISTVSTSSITNCSTPTSDNAGVNGFRSLSTSNAGGAAYYYATFAADAEI